MSDGDDSPPVKEKVFSTPESKDKTYSKFKNILDDLELKAKPKSLIKKTEPSSINSKSDTTNNSTTNTNSNTASNNKNSTKEQKSKLQPQNGNITTSDKNDINNSKLKNKNKFKDRIRRFNFFDEDFNKAKKVNKGAEKKEESTKIKSNDINNNNNKNKTKKNFVNNFKGRNSFDNGINKSKNLLTMNKKNNISSSNNRHSFTNLNNIGNKISKRDNKKEKEKLRPATPGIRRTPDDEKEKESSNKKNNNSNKDGNIKKTNNKEKGNVEKIDPLYIPHIVEDPLDVLKNKVELILEKSNEDISNLCNDISVIDIEMESSYAKLHLDYADNLKNLYKEKESKLLEINNKYDFALYKMFKTYGHENNKIYDDMMKDKVEQILEVEQEFNAKKNKLKNDLNIKSEEVKKIFEKKRKEQEKNNIQTLEEIKKKLFNILYEGDKKETGNNPTDNNKKTKMNKTVFLNKK